MMKRFSDQQLYILRNNLPIHMVIEKILMIPCKYVEGLFRFLCPLCSEFNTSAKLEKNLARCFLCARNFNTIDIVMFTRHWSFVESVKFLQEYYDSMSSQLPVATFNKKLRTDSEASPDRRAAGSIKIKPVSIGDILQKTLKPPLKETTNAHLPPQLIFMIEQIEKLGHKVDQLAKQVDQIVAKQGQIF